MTLKPEHIVEALNKKTFDEIDPDEVLKHYGYKPEEVRCNGVGIGVWRKEEAFQKLGDIGAFMRFVDHGDFAKMIFGMMEGREKERMLGIRVLIIAHNAYKFQGCAQIYRNYLPQHIAIHVRKQYLAELNRKRKGGRNAQGDSH